MKKLALATIILLSLSSKLYAQVNAVAFTASPDHSIQVSGANVVEFYEMTVYISNAGAPGAVQWTEPLGKPAPNAQNTIQLQVPRLSTLNRGTYVATVAAVSPNGVKGVSTPSDPFSITGTVAPPGKPSVIRLSN